MQTNILRYLFSAAARFPDKTAVNDGTEKLTYKELLAKSRSAGAAIASLVKPHYPIGVYMGKCTAAIPSFMGAVFAGCFYCSLNPELPDMRLCQIYDVLSPAVIITTDELKRHAAEIFTRSRILTSDELFAAPPDGEKLAEREETHTDTDPLYINFTSGSTGTPKGIVVSHKSVIDFIDCFTDTFRIDENDIIANQAPFDFDVSVKDIYSALKTGAQLLIVPRELFSAPVQLTDFLCDNNATVMIWAVSALCLITTFHCLDYRTPKTVRKILFSGEVMPLRALREFKKHLPDAVYVNLYGPTEITCNCTYHILSPERDYSGGIPIGTPFTNEDVFLLDENDKEITSTGTPGEICVRGSCLALGYYGCPEQNEKHFTQNPLNPYYPERIYRTGDLGKYGENGELYFCGRRDFQIKYMGHRIELEEIERMAAEENGVERFCCIFDEKHSRLKGFYVGTAEKDELHKRLSQKLPAFMVPGMLFRIDEFPLTKNGKTDRKKLAEFKGDRQ